MTKFKFILIKQFLVYFYYKVYWIWIITLREKHKAQNNKQFTIGITTFCERYDVLFKDLIKRIVYLFPETEIIIAVNGHYCSTKQMLYLSKINTFCKKFPNVKLITFDNPQGLSRLWNHIIKNSKNDKVFLFNDDILFNYTLQYDIYKCGILDEKVSLLNDSFSHFLIDKSVIREVGWFDERFTEIGGEDDDYHVRLVLKGIELKRHFINRISSYKPKLMVNSYGHNIVEQSNGYSNANTKFLFQKWDIQHNNFDGAKYIIKSQGKYWKLRSGMETPDFYQSSKSQLT